MNTHTLLSMPKYKSENDEKSNFPPTLMVTWEVAEEFGGMTATCLKRAGMFHENGTPTGVLTFAPMPNIASIQKNLILNKKIHPNVPIINLHQYYSEQLQGTVYTDQYKPFLEQNLEKIEHESLIRDDGTILRETFTGPEVSAKQYFRTDGTTYLTDITHGKKRELTLFDLKHPKGIHFNTAGAFYRHWLTEIVDTTQANIIVDSKYAAQFISPWNHPNVVKLFCFHSPHTTVNRNPVTADLSGGHRAVISKRKNWDGFIFLTEAQKRAFIMRFGEQSNLFNIGNSISEIESEEVLNDKNQDRIVILGRLSTEKNVEDAIKIFSIARQSCPDSILDIIGDGPTKDSLLALVQDLNLTQSVQFHGYVPHSAQFLKSAKILLSTSSFEGQGMAIMEAQANACVPIAYDVDFGPRDLIKNGENGFLINFKDFDSAANHVIQLLRDESHFRLMGQASLQSSKRHQQGENLIRWQHVLNITTSRKKIWEQLSAFQPQVTSLKLGKKNSLIVILKRFDIPGTKITLLAVSRGTSLSEATRISPHKFFRNLHFNLSHKTINSFKKNLFIDFYIECTYKGISQTVRLSGPPKADLLPYFTENKNLSLKQ